MSVRATGTAHAAAQSALQAAWPWRNEGDISEGAILGTIFKISANETPAS